MNYPGIFAAVLLGAAMLTVACSSSNANSHGRLYAQSPGRRFVVREKQVEQRSA